MVEAEPNPRTPAAERWHRAKSLLAEALAIADPAQRREFVARACAAEPELQRDLESLLEQTTGGLEACAEEMRHPTAESGEGQTGERIGPYVLERELGRGGWGCVWLAARADGRWEQQVAIKLLRRGVDTEEVLRRFRAERQILARLEHPNIARLLDGGETADGLPFLVMEYVVGTNVADYCQAHALSLPDRLQLFRKVCEAVAFAHQNLVIHRDLKPGNIMVGVEGEPKLLDFGIAKLLDPAQDTAVTAEDRRAYTAAYASPEQVSGGPVTTLADVYSLGALLYELLVGRSPHRFSKAHPTVGEIERVVGLEMPLRPSLAVASPAGRRSLRGDLDNIVLRALAKDPMRRYASVRALAEDLRRHLEGHPVQARPDTWSYRTGKFLRRHKLPVAALALLLVALLGGAAATLWQARRAERRFQDVRRLANAFLFEFHDAIASLTGATPARRLIVSRGLEYLDLLARESAGDAELQLELAAAYLQVGDVQGKPYTPNLGDAAGALASYRKAADLAGPQAERERGSGRTIARALWCRAANSLGTLLGRMGRSDSAAEEHRRSLAVSQLALAEEPVHAAIWRPLVVGALTGLGDAVQSGNHQLGSVARYRDAIGHYRAALLHAAALAQGRPAVSEEARSEAGLSSRLASILAELGQRTGDAEDFRESLRLHARNLQLLEAALATAPENGRFRRTLGDALVASAYARQLARTDLPAALSDCRRALALLGPLAAADPSNREAQQDLSYAHYNTGRVLQSLEQPAAAAAEYRRCLEILEPLVAAYPDNAEAAFDLQRARAGLAEAEPR